MSSTSGYSGNAKDNPRTMVWEGDVTDKPDPFEYWHIDDAGNNYMTSDWSPTPAAPLWYDDNGNIAWSGGWPVDKSYVHGFTVLVHNYNAKMCAIYAPNGDDGWKKISPNIVGGRQASVTMPDGGSFRVDFVG